MEQNSTQWPLESPKNILVRMPNWLGDLVMATPILYDLRQQWPLATITVMCQGAVGTLLQNDPNIDHIYSYKKPNGWIHRSHPHEIIDFLQKGHYDLGVLLTNSLSSAWWLWRGQVRHRIGFACNLRSLFLNKAVPFPEKKETQHLVITYKELLKPLGISVSNTPPKLYVAESEKQAALSILSTYGLNPNQYNLIGINPGAAFGTAKCWLPDRFRSVTQKLLEDPKNAVIYFGDPTGASLVNDICQGFGDRVVNLAGKTTIRELLALIQTCTVMLTNDSGPMHISSALNVPLVALFGSTSDVKTGPYAGGIVIHKHVECSPCYKKVCPIDFRCMKRIEIDEVYEAVAAIIRKARDPFESF